MLDRVYIVVNLLKPLCKIHVFSFTRNTICAERDTVVSKLLLAPGLSPLTELELAWTPGHRLKYQAPCPSK